MNDDVVIQAECGTLIFWCHGCLEYHGVWLAAHPNPTTGAAWTWNGDKLNPTFSPSIVVQQGTNQPRCHSFVVDGVIEYLSDCGHALASQKMRLQPVEYIRRPSDCQPSHRGPIKA